MNWHKNKIVKNILRQAQKFQTSIILALIGVALIGAGLSVSKLLPSSQEPTFVPAEKEKAVNEKIMIDIEGAVKKPGLHELVLGTRIDDAIKAAGGMSKKADKDWVSKNLNLAAKLGDGQKIYIPKIGETNISRVSGQVASEIRGKININTASESELDTLPGIGPVTAGKIIANRPYSQIEEVRSKGAVGD
jgi:competence protein ComEA